MDLWPIVILVVGTLAVALGLGLYVLITGMSLVTP